MQRGSAQYNSLGKYRQDSKPREPVKDDEIRVSSTGVPLRYASYANGLLTEKGKKKITIKATGNAIASAISTAELIKRQFHNIHQQNIIGTTKSVNSYETKEGLEPVTHRRYVPFIEIYIALEEELLDTTSIGYQKPIDQNLVTPYTPNIDSSQRGRRMGSRGRGRGSMRRGVPRQYGGRGDGPMMRGRYNQGPRRGGYRGRPYQGGPM